MDRDDVYTGLKVIKNINFKLGPINNIIALLIIRIFNIFLLLLFSSKF